MPLTWHHIPVLRLLLPFVAGVLFGMYSNAWFFAFAIAAGCMSVVFIAALFFKPLTQVLARQWIFGAALQVIGVCAGYLTVYVHTPVHAEDYFMKDADTSSVFMCRIYKPPLIGEKSIRLEVQMQCRLQDGDAANTSGKSLIYIRRDSTVACNWQYGDVLLIKNIFVTPEPPDNPGAFNYATYLKRLGIYHIAFASADEVHATGIHSPRRQWQQIFRARTYFHDVLQRYLQNADALTVGEALVIGTRTDISDTIRDAYAHTGTMHILAVSGLHVGILFAVLEFLLRPLVWLHRSAWGKAWKCLLLLAVIWWYACLAGLSPSVNRSAVMFSFLSLGKLMERQNNTFNILFASMLVLMLDDPWCITQAGFQLSYLAVGGIVYFQPIMQKIVRPRNMVLNYVWTMITVSIAAQVATMPVTLFYFHQFPNYFLLSNLLAIPVSFVVLVAGLILFAVGSIAWLAAPVAAVFEWSLMLLNGSVVAVDQLPYAVTDHLHVTVTQMLLMYLLLFCIGAFLVLREKIWLKAGVGVLAVLSAVIALPAWQLERDERLALYALPRQELFSYTAGGQVVVFADLPVADTGDAWLRQVKPDLIAHGGAPDTLVVLQDTAMALGAGWARAFPWVIAGSEVVFLLDPTSVHRLPDSAPQVTVLYIIGDPFLDLPDLRTRFPAARLVIGGTSPWKRRTYYARAGRKAGFEVHDLLADGACVSSSQP